MTNEPRIMSEKNIRDKFHEHISTHSVNPSEACDWFLSLRRQEHEAMRAMIKDMKKILPENPKSVDGLGKNLIDSIAFSIHNQALDRVLSEAMPKENE